MIAGHGAGYGSIAMEAIIVFAVVIVLAALSAFATRTVHDRSLRPDDPALGSYGATEPGGGPTLAMEPAGMHDRRAGQRPLPTTVVDLKKAA